jgi:hypothetical protein
MSELYFATGPNKNQINDLITFKGPEKPNILISYFYLKAVEKVRPLADFKGHRMMLDSGAYSAYNSGKSVDIDALIEESKKPIWDEAVGLDVIGDAEGSRKNARYMADKGSKAFPVFHIGDPWDLLKEYCDKFDKIGLSCRFGEPVNESLAWYDECFARQWPHKFHSFGWIVESMLMRFPFHSADASTWALRPNAFGQWQSLNILGSRVGQKIASSKHGLHTQISWYMKSQAKLRLRWAVEFKKQGWVK